MLLVGSLGRKYSKGPKSNLVSNLELQRLVDKHIPCTRVTLVRMGKGGER